MRGDGRSTGIRGSVTYLNVCRFPPSNPSQFDERVVEDEWLDYEYAHDLNYYYGSGPAMRRRVFGSNGLTGKQMWVTKMGRHEGAVGCDLSVHML